MSEAIKNIDWDLLSKQKLTLVEMVMYPTSGQTKEQNHAIEGIVALLDAMQDENQAIVFTEDPRNIKALSVFSFDTDKNDIPDIIKGLEALEDKEERLDYAIDNGVHVWEKYELEFSVTEFLKYISE